MNTQGKENTMVDMTWDYYYRWILAMAVRVTMDNGSLLSLAIAMESNVGNIDWILDAAKKIHTLIPSKFDNNTEARTLGRRGEQQVVDLLIENGWTIEIRPSGDLRPKFGTSTVGYDIVASINNVRRKIEVKTSNTHERVWCSYKHHYKIVNNNDPNHFTVFVWNNQIFYARTINIRFIGYATNFKHRNLKFNYCVDPACLKPVRSIEEIQWQK